MSALTNHFGKLFAVAAAAVLIWLVRDISERWRQAAYGSGEREAAARLAGHRYDYEYADYLIRGLKTNEAAEPATVVLKTGARLEGYYSITGGGFVKLHSNDESKLVGVVIPWDNISYVQSSWKTGKD